MNTIYRTFQKLELLNNLNRIDEIISRKYINTSDKQKLQNSFLKVSPGKFNLS